MPRFRLSASLLASLALPVALLAANPGVAAASHGRTALAESVAVGKSGAQARAARSSQRPQAEHSSIASNRAQRPAPAPAP